MAENEPRKSKRELEMEAGKRALERKQAGYARETSAGNEAIQRNALPPANPVLGANDAATNTDHPDHASRNPDGSTKDGSVPGENAPLTHAEAQEKGLTVSMEIGRYVPGEPIPEPGQGHLINRNPANNPDMALVATGNGDPNAGVEATVVTVPDRQTTVVTEDSPNTGGQRAVAVPDAGTMVEEDTLQTGAAGGDSTRVQNPQRDAHANAAVDEANLALAGERKPQTEQAPVRDTDLTDEQREALKPAQEKAAEQPKPETLAERQARERAEAEEARKAAEARIAAKRAEVKRIADEAAAKLQKEEKAGKRQAKRKAGDTSKDAEEPKSQDDFDALLK